MLSTVVRVVFVSVTVTHCRSSVIGSIVVRTVVILWWPWSLGGACVVAGFGSVSVVYPVIRTFSSWPISAVPSMVTTLI